MRNIDLSFRTYYRPLCLYALHYLRDVQAAEDTVQDCFVSLLEAEVTPENTRAWLYTAVRNRCIDQLRRRQPLFADIQPTDLDGCITDEEAQERSLHEAELWTAVDTLPPRCREVLLLAKRDGLTYNEIALRMGISVKTVEHQMSKALRTLRKRKADFFYSFLSFV